MMHLFVWMQRLRHLVICHLQAGGSGTPLEFQSHPKAWQPAEPMIWISVQVWRVKSGAQMSKGRRRWMTHLKQTANSPFLGLWCYSFFQQTGWCPLHCKGWSTLLSLSIWMLISSENTLTETPINNVLLATWTQANWHIKPTLIGGDPGNWRNEDIREKSQQAGGILIGWLQWKTDALSCPDPLRDYACHFSIQ